MNIERIKKLLALSGQSNSNAAESQAAFAKAKQLADESGIDLALIEAQTGKEAEKEEFTDNELDLGKRKKITQKFVNWLLCKHFNVEILSGGRRCYGRKMWILGRESDAEFAIFANQFLNDEFMRLWFMYKKENSLTAKERNAYLWGLYNGLNDKLEKSREEQIKNRINQQTESEESFDKNSTKKSKGLDESFQLVVKKEKELLREFVNKKHRVSWGRGSSNYISGLHRQSIIDAGIRTGKTINVNRPLPCI